jgi:hypothetical protein
MAERGGFNRNLIINAQGDVRKVPYPVANPEIISLIKRPTLTSYKDGLEWNKQAQEHADKALSFTQEYAKVHVEPREDNKIYIVNMSDIHWGHYDTDYDYVDKLFTTLEKSPNTYAVFGWNILDAAIPAKFPDGVMWSGQTAQEQVYTMNDKLKKLHSLNKILGAIGDSSCHEGWSKRATGWMIYRELFDGVDVPLLLNGGYLDVEVEDQNYRLALFHKIKYFSTFNKTHGGDRAMDRMVDAEVVFTSHLHQAAVGQSNRYNPPFKKETAVVSSGTCKLHDKWARGGMGTEGEPGGQGIMLWANEHKFNVIYDLQTGSELMNNGQR